MTESVTVEVCTDCAVWLANHDDTGLDNLSEQEAAQRRAEIAAADQKAAKAGEHWIITGYDSHFSKSACDYCLSPLGGDRIEATVQWEA